MSTTDEQQQNQQNLLDSSQNNTNNNEQGNNNISSNTVGGNEQQQQQLDIPIPPHVPSSATNQQQQQNPNRPRRILMMGPNDGGKTSMAKVIFENCEPARTQYQGKTQGPVPEDIFLFGRKLFTFFDCGGQVSYFDDYLKDPYLFNGVAALVFVVDATLFFLSSNNNNNNMNGGGGGGDFGGYGNNSSGNNNGDRTWNPQTIRDVFGKIVKTLLDKSPDARVFLMLNKMDKVQSTPMDPDQIDAIVNDNGKRLQRVAYDTIYNHHQQQRLVILRQQQQQQQQQDVDTATNATNTTQDENGGVDGNAAATAAVPGDHQQDNNNPVTSSESPSANLTTKQLEQSIPLFKTSIFSNSIVHAWSQVVTRLIEPSSALKVLREWLDQIRESAGGEILEAALLDSSTLLCVANSSAFSTTDETFLIPSSTNLHNNGEYYAGAENNNNSTTNVDENPNTAHILFKNSNFYPVNTTEATLSSEMAIRAKRQRLKGLDFVTITHPAYNMVWRNCIPERLQLLLVGDGKMTTPGVTQMNSETLVEWFNSRFVDDESSRFPPPWPLDVVQVRQLLGTL